MSLSRHAGTRAQQRGVPHAALEALFAYADGETPAGGGCSVLRLSRTALSSPEIRAALGRQADRLGSLAVVINGDGEIVTVLHDRGGAAGRRYRRAH
jgi:hypothetical protein